jgi:hypothetical protein
MLESAFNVPMIPFLGKVSSSSFAVDLSICRYFKKILFAMSGAPFYTKFIQFPTGELVPSKIQNNPKFWPYFRNAIGTIDGSHIPIAPPAHLHGQFHNWKGFLSQNALFTCDFNLNFTYSLTGWEGSATDAHVYDDAISTNLCIPLGKYLLADAGYPLQPQLLVPYRSTRYHLAEWAWASQRYVICFSTSSFNRFFSQAEK